MGGPRPGPTGPKPKNGTVKQVFDFKKNSERIIFSKKSLMMELVKTHLFNLILHVRRVIQVQTDRHIKTWCKVS